MAESRAIADELSEFEKSLAALRPNSSGLSRDELMFLAGRLAGKETTLPAPTRWLWSAYSAVASCLAIALAAALLWQMSRPVEQIAAPRPQQQPPHESVAADAPREEPLTEPPAIPVRRQSPSVADAAPYARRDDARRDNEAAATDYLALRRRLLSGEDVPPSPATGASGEKAPPSYWEESQRLAIRRPPAAEYPPQDIPAWQSFFIPGVEL